MVDEILCPSAPAQAEDARIIGVIDRTANGPRVAYVAGEAPVDNDVLSSMHGVLIDQVLRTAAKCENGRCAHFDGTDCMLAKRIMQQMEPSESHLPACSIRRSCRWHQQEGAPACLRCSQVVTGYDRADQNLDAIANPSVEIC